MTNISSLHAISFIVPVYNAEQYLDECLNSLFSQTIAKQIEYVFINDASTDNSLNILQEKSKQHPELEIHIISNSKNQGSASSRNTGIRYAHAPYLMFTDSDDWIEPDMARALLQKATDENAEIVSSDFYTNYSDKQRTFRFDANETSILLNTANNDVLHFSLWNKLFSRKLITDNLLYAIEGCNCWEDLSITSRALALADKNVILHQPFYHYRKYAATSLTTQDHKRILQDHLRYTTMLEEWFRSRGDKFFRQHSQFICRLKFVAKIKMLRGNVIEISRWKNTFTDTHRHIWIAAKQFSPLMRLAFIALAKCPTPIAKFIAKATGHNAE